MYYIDNKLTGRAEVPQSKLTGSISIRRGCCSSPEVLLSFHRPLTGRTVNMKRDVARRPRSPSRPERGGHRAAVCVGSVAPRPHPPPPPAAHCTGPTRGGPGEPTGPAIFVSYHSVLSNNGKLYFFICIRGEDRINVQMLKLKANKICKIHIIQYYIMG